MEDVPCGSYTLTTSKPGFVSKEDVSARLTSLFAPKGLGPNDSEATEQSGGRPSPAFTTVNVGPESPPTSIQLVPVACIAGTVLDENGDPIYGAAVQSIAVRASLDGADYAPVRSGHTDDRGGFAFFDLAPGDYVVRLAGEASSTRYFMGSRLNPGNNHRGLQPVYYPNGDSPASASVLHLAPGDRAEVDFHQATENAFDIDGRLTGLAQGAWTQLQLYRSGDRLPLGAAFVNLSSGQFRVIDVPRGSYTLRAVQYQADPEKWLAAEVQVVVTSEPIRNLTVQLSGGADIPVSVSYEAGARADGVTHLMLHPQHTRSNLRVLTIGGRAVRPPGLEQESSEPASAPQAPAFTNVIPDRYRLTVQPLANDGDYVASARLGEVDVLNDEFSISGPAAGELQVTIRGDSATLEGRVTFKGQPAPGAQVYLAPAAGGLRTGVCDDDGQYEISGIPPGDYRIKAWTGAPTVEEILSKPGDTVALHAGEHRTMALEAAPAGDQSVQGKGAM